MSLEPIRRLRTKRKGLSLRHLRFMADYAPESQKRVLLLGGTLGGRIMELLRAEDAWFDLDAATVTLLAWATKERREKHIDLLGSEVGLVREQRLVRSPDTERGQGGTLYVFPRPRGTPWKTHSGFWNQVVLPTRRAAAEAWRTAHGLPSSAPTPYEWIETDSHGKAVIDVDGKPRMGGFAPHDLRRGAVDLLLELGLTHDLVAARLGHKDAGYLVATTYSTVNRERLRRELKRIDAEGGIDARLSRRSNPDE